jgi:hypothetical protein
MWYQFKTLKLYKLIIQTTRMSPVAHLAYLLNVYQIDELWNKDKVSWGGGTGL